MYNANLTIYLSTDKTIYKYLFPTLLLHHLKILIVHIIDGYGIATEIHDKLAVAVDTDNVAFLPLEDACENTETHVVLGELHKRLAKERDALRSGGHQCHERSHDTVGDGRRTASTAVVDKIVLRKIQRKKCAKLQGGALKENETAHGWLLLLHYAFAIGFLAVAQGAVNKTVGLEASVNMAGLKPFLKNASRHVLYEDIAPRQGNLIQHFAQGHISHSRSRFSGRSDYIDALW